MTSSITRRNSFSPVTDVRYVAASDGRSFYLWIVVTFVEAEVLWPPRRRLRPTSNYTAQGSGCSLHIMQVCFRDDDGKRSTSLVCEEMSLCAKFGPIRRIRTRGFPPKGAFTVRLSSDCHSQLMPLSSSYRSRSFTHSFWKTPFLTHSWNRLWQVDPEPYSAGNAFHWQPVRSTYSMPSRTLLNGTTGRPLVPTAFSCGSNG